MFVMTCQQPSKPPPPLHSSQLNEVLSHFLCVENHSLWLQNCSMPVIRGLPLIVFKQQTLPFSPSLSNIQSMGPLNKYFCFVTILPK